MTARAVTKAQAAVLAHINAPRHLSQSHDPTGARYYFNGGGLTVHWRCGETLEARGWIVKLKREAGSPFWRTDYDITEAGRVALANYARQAQRVSPAKRRPGGGAQEGGADGR